MDRFIQVGDKTLRCGYTTGTCAAGAAAAAAWALLRGSAPAVVTVQLPDGSAAQLEPLLCTPLGQSVITAAVVKDAGDDYDITHGTQIQATVQLTKAPGIAITGGLGVGVVTKPGLACKVGQPAINPVPQAMIETSLRAIFTQFAYKGGAQVEIAVPQGQALAKKTFNPRLGIVGGISILGTSGIVRPMSEEALLESIFLELGQKRILGYTQAAITLGNYGETFASTHLQLPLGSTVQCSNFVGASLQKAAALGFTQILLLGDLGKLAKLAVGADNTHSRYGVRPTAVMHSYAKQAGASAALLAALTDCATTTAALSLLQTQNLQKTVLESMFIKIQQQVSHWTTGAQSQVLLFSGQEIIAQTQGVQALAARLHKEYQEKNK